DFASAFWFAELGPAVTPPAVIVTGALPFTGVCCTADVAAETCAATAAWMDAWSAPAPPFSADATAGTATAAATVATNAISFRFITPPSLWSSFSDAAPAQGRRIDRSGGLSRVARSGGRSGAALPVDAAGPAGSRPPGGRTGRLRRVRRGAGARVTRRPTRRPPRWERRGEVVWREDRPEARAGAAYATRPVSRAASRR